MSFYKIKKKFLSLNNGLDSNFFDIGILFLASDEARHITGEIIDVNGGLFMD